MSVQLQSLDLRQFMTNHLAEVFETMLSLKPTPVTVGPAPDSLAGRVTGSVGFGGENVTGAVYLHLTSTFATEIAANMLGLPPAETGEAEVNDVVGECTNMLAGGLKSMLCDIGATCAVSTPAIIRGTAYEIEALHDIRRELLYFECQGAQITVEIHIKFN